MFDSRSAFGFLVQTPFGPRKSGMPDSVEMPAPVSATIRTDEETNRRAVARRSLIASVYSGYNSSIPILALGSKYESLSQRTSRASRAWPARLRPAFHWRARAMVELPHSRNAANAR